MSYEVTATRRRPQKFDDLVGQEFVAETLKNSIKSGKIAHAYLFAGPRGCGKTSTARILAKALNCANGPTDCPCGQCSNCLEITKGSSLDVIEIDGASNNGVDISRQIKDEVMFPPAKCRYKIYIIDEVHMLSTPAFNALLKTIEEPPAYAIFIFATTELQKVPATIKSRCQQYNFRLVAIDKVKQCLAEAAAELNIQADDEALFWIARESTGSMRDAYTLFDQIAAFSDGHMTYEKIRDKLGLVGIDRLNMIFDGCAQNQTEKVLTLLDEFLQAGVSIDQIISNSADYLRSLLLIKSGIVKESLLGNSPERYSRTVLNAWNSVQIERALSIFLQLYRDIRYSLSPRYELELAFSRLCWIGQYVSNVEVKKAIDAAQNLLMGNAGAPQAVARNSIASGTPAVNGNSLASGGPAGNGNLNASVPPAVNGNSSAISGPVVNVNQAVSAAPAVNVNLNASVPPAANVNSNAAVSPAANVTLQVSDAPAANVNPIASGGPAVNVNLNATEAPAAPSPYAGMSPAEVAAATLSGDLPVPSLKESENPHPGLPKLSMLAELEKQQENPPAPEGDGSNPFSNGGSLPPQQSVKISVSSEDTFTENPDDEDDGWTNTAEPPEEDFYVESDQVKAQRLEDTFEKENTADKKAEMAPAQNNESFQAATGSMTIGQLRGNVMAGLSVSNGFISAALEKTGLWKVENDTVTTTVENNYEQSLLQKNISIINQEISKVCGKPMLFKVELGQKKAVTKVIAEIPNQVKILVDAFRGSIIGR